MPTYEYACTLCGHQMDIFQSIKDERLVTCPQCKEDGLKRLIGTGAGLIFKGSGFYQTDYKGGGNSGKEGSGEKKSSESPSPAPAPAGGSPAPSSSGASTSSSSNSNPS